MTAVHDSLGLPALDGSNPIGFLAALGVLSCLDRAGVSPTLRWVDDLVPTAVLTGAASVDDVVAVIDADRTWWATKSVVFGWPKMPDVKADPAELHKWSLAVREAWLARPDVWCLADVRLWTALVAEGALAGKGNAKPTHLHFTAGQQQFLDMARQLARSVDGEHFRQALMGPWRYDSPLPSFGWDARGDRVYALRATDPSKERRLGVPGCDWLALLGLAFLPVAARRGRLHTTGCERSWKSAPFRWPLWSVPASPHAVAGLLGDQSLASGAEAVRKAAGDYRGRGVFAVMEVPIRRTEQGGYGSFGAPTELLRHAPPSAVHRS